MEQFRQVGEVLGSLKALMVLKDDIQINQRQCCLLQDMFELAFAIMSELIKLYLKAEERNTKWKALEMPLRELHRVFKEGELYVRQCFDNRDWWAKAISLHQNKDCVEYHVHNLLSCFPGVIEAIESVAEVSGLDPDEMQRRRVTLSMKYNKEWNDPKMFQLRFAKEYLIPREICSRFESAWKEDRWLLVEALREKRRLGSVVLTKNEQQLVDMLLQKLNGSNSSTQKLFPTSILVRGKDYQVRRRLGGGSDFKEIQWLGDSFAVRCFFGEIEDFSSEISSLLSLSHPNILQYHCGFFDEEKKEFLLVMELMNKDLSVYIKENSGSRRRVLFSIPVVIDLLLQIARGMEFLHSKKIYHGDLNPSNIFLKPRPSAEGYFHAKVSGFGLTNVKSRPCKRSQSPPPPAAPAAPTQNGASTSGSQENQELLFIWHAPEVLAEQEQPRSTSTFKYTAKADVYSFGMLCFEILTGKVPFEDGHLQGDKMARNIRAGERPLFPSNSPKYLVNLTKRCWHTNPSMRPSFQSICRVLRYIKKYLVLNPESIDTYLSPLGDYYDIEAGYVKNFVGEGNPDAPSISQIPFQMFSYSIAEKDKNNVGNNEQEYQLTEESALLDLISPEENEGTSIFSDVKSAILDSRSVYSEFPGKRISNFDTRSVFSEAPNKNIVRCISSFTRPVPKLEEKKIVAEFDSRSERNVEPERRIIVSDTRSVGAKTTERKIIPIIKPVNAKTENGSEAGSARLPPSVQPVKSSVASQSQSGRSSRPTESSRRFPTERRNCNSAGRLRRKSTANILGSEFSRTPSRRTAPHYATPIRRTISAGIVNRKKSTRSVIGSEGPGISSSRREPKSIAGSEYSASHSRRKGHIHQSRSASPVSSRKIRTAVACPERPETSYKVKKKVNISDPEVSESSSGQKADVNVSSSGSPVSNS